LVEARSEESRELWQYAFARLTIYALDGGMDGTTLWNVPRIKPGGPDYRETFFHRWRAFSQYPFALDRKSAD
jgi:hypothetical protein